MEVLLCDQHWDLTRAQGESGTRCPPPLCPQGLPVMTVTVLDTCLPQLSLLYCCDEGAGRIGPLHSSISGVNNWPC